MLVINLPDKKMPITPQRICKYITCVSTWGYNPPILKKGIAAKIVQVAKNTKASDIIVLNLEVNLPE